MRKNKVLFLVKGRNERPGEREKHNLIHLKRPAGIMGLVLATKATLTPKRRRGNA